MSRGDKPAFSRPSTDTAAGHPGMTIREYFAAHALQGLLASGARTIAASVAVEQADALLRELEKPTGEQA